MERAEVLKKINDIFKDAFDDDSMLISEATKAADIEDWDSLMHITLITATEKAFGIRFTFNEVGSMQNVGEMINIIVQRVGK